MRRECRSRVRQRLGDPVKAFAFLQRAVVLDPSSLPAQFALGISAMNLRRYHEAIAAFQAATKLDANDVAAQQWLGNAYEAVGQTAQAEAAYGRALQLLLARQRRKHPPQPWSTPNILWEKNPLASR